MINSGSRQKSICMLGKHLFSRAQFLFLFVSILHYFLIINALTVTLLYFITQRSKIKFKRLHVKQLPSDSISKSVDSFVRLNLSGANKLSALWGLESVNSLCS